MKFLKKACTVIYNDITEDVFDIHTEQAVHYFNLRDSVEAFHDNTFGIAG